jgi:hypothetical protein
MNMIPKKMKAVNFLLEMLFHILSIYSEEKWCGSQVKHVDSFEYTKEK